MADSKLSALSAVTTPLQDGDLVYIVRSGVSYKTTFGELKTAIAEFSTYPEVANFAALPAAADHSGETYVVIASQGVYFVNRKPAGLYRSDGANWVYLADATEAYFQDTLAWTNITSKPSSFAPSAHASTHAAAGSDPITIAQSQVANLATDLAAKAAASALTAHTADTANPHLVTKAQVGLGNCDNTSDANKPISTATQTALDAKAASSHTHATSDVTGLAELIEDTIGAKVVAGTNITVSYNDTTGETTVSSSGGGGGGGGIDAVPVVASIAYNTSVSSSTNTEAIVPLESIVLDPASAWSIGGNGGLIAPAAGTYECSAIIIRYQTNSLVDQPGFGFSVHGGSTRSRIGFMRSDFPSNDPFWFSTPKETLTVSSGAEIELKLTSFNLSYGNVPAVSITTHFQRTKCHVFIKRIR